MHRGSPLVALQALAPPVGSVELSTSPSPSTATHSVADGHDSAEIAAHAPPLWQDPDNAGSVYWSVQALGPPAGFVEVRIWLPENATQSDTVGHDKPDKPLAGPAANVHALAPPVGRFEVRTPPLPSATQNETDGQETVEIETSLDVQASASPPGLVVVRMCPTLSPATQKDTDGQEIVVTLFIPPPGMRLPCQAEAPPAGLWDANSDTATSVAGWAGARPLPSATQRRTEGHEIAPRL